MNYKSSQDRIYCYKAFDLIWESHGLSLKGLKEKQRISNPDVKISYKSCNLWPAQEQINYEDKYLKITDNQLMLNIPDVAKFFISNGQQIFISKTSENYSIEEPIRTYLLGSAIGALLIQRGILLFHGNSLEKNGRAIICLGDSGVGKSTIAYQLMKDGWNLISDDLVALDLDNNVLPGIPRIKLWEDAISHFGLDTIQLNRVAKGFNKFVITKKRINCCNQKVKLEKVLILNRYEENFIKSKKIKSQKECLESLIKNYYRPLFIRFLNYEKEYFLHINRILKCTPIYNLYLPNNLKILSNSLYEFIN